jgi:16S rRNA (guanine(966)-N(2))-methyltransferase RsmD
MRVIAGSARRILLKTVDGLETRPTTDRIKETLFNILQPDIPGARVLDLFSGSGALGIEALSRGASSAVFVDGWKDACQLVRENLRLTRLTDKAKVVNSDYLSYLQSCREKFDIVFLDPPYAEIFLENALNKISEIDILSDRGIIICERPAEKQLDLEISGLQRSKDYRYGKTWVTVFRKA